MLGAGLSLSRKTQALKPAMLGLGRRRMAAEGDHRSLEGFVDRER
jgi:hypothetical protein